MHCRSVEAVIVVLEGSVAVVTDDDESVLCEGDVASSRQQLFTEQRPSSSALEHGEYDESLFQGDDGRVIESAWLKGSRPKV